VAKSATTTQRQQQQTAKIKIGQTEKQKQQTVVDKAATINGRWKKRQYPPSGNLLRPPS